MSTTASEFLDLFFSKLDELEIPYVIIHSYQNLPHDVKGDIDYAVPEAWLRRMTDIQQDLGKQHNWRVVQSFRHGVFAYYNVLVSLDDPTQILQLDACSNYARARRLLVPSKVLLDGRKRHESYWVPQPAAEFIYEATKLFDAKMKDPAKYLPKLKASWQLDKEHAQALFNRAFGETGRTVEEWFAQPPSEWQRLRGLMLARNRFGPLLLAREAWRVAARVLRPTGVQVSLLGPDGSGKTTLIEGINTRLGPMFRRFKVFHFRPTMNKSANAGTPVTDPHGKTPYGLAISCAKLTYYLASYWQVYLLRLLKLRIESTLILFDRDFHDMLVDGKRYRLARTSRWLARLIIGLTPKSDLTFVLDVDPVACHLRKPELTIPELERQRKQLLTLADEKKSWTVIDANQSPAIVADQVCRKIVDLLIKRSKSC